MGIRGPGRVAFLGAAGGYTQCVKVYHSAGQTLANNTVTTLAFDTEEFDTDAMHDTVTNNSRITFKTAGKYLVCFGVEFAANATGRRSATIRKGGATTLLWVQYEAVSEAGKTSIVNGQSVFEFAANDYIELRAYQSSGGNLDVGGVTSTGTWFAAVRVG